MRQCETCRKFIKNSHLGLCPFCGSNRFIINMFDKAKLYECIEIRAKEKGYKRPTREIESGDNFCDKDNKWYHKERIIERKNDRYKEIVIDPKTGKIIHHCEEPLSKHQSHGSAKAKKK